ncbi:MULTISPECIES: aromatic ring-opening dioxygenase LigA [Cryobacterium]|uniref:Aromatic ring-opening dioxygenase LigA n=2 Tax=Cryobacterium TaxID=69578 RepID=A0AA41UFL8_9MICO|nr:MULTISPECIES: aromatic ring-opening dioxygenase LigA [Cryobacterium]MCI4658763.1 aromatic ring-opening dioxygenase LigA [Cryobacterium zhongshanensis]MDY7527377.1 aromatic ring-opening dioxygenase LigA [Cryobacterium sp. 10C2]MEB0004216.1 aromatic ring-opening dioxygenase LigA [Cryobacterium sp. RTC2.1]MEB0202321.1 aromatic ring-opening dioxygenase LigA [Cryobacterium sp. 5I3]MEB0286498.1 aromatic ring-opening dioxygenase LigA [Cryobacterium sp. 10S3]
MTTATTTAAQPLIAGSGQARILRIIGLLGIIGGLVMLLVGGVVWGTVSSQLAGEKITVAADASFLAGTTVDNPLSALAQANIINHHAMEASGGKTYAELAQDDKVRPTVMTASLLRASLFTSIVAFGVSFFAMGLGILVGLFGWAIFVLTPHASKKTAVPAVA